MDSGLGVQWPLSPYATVLAAGALFAFCFALWKHRLGAKRRTWKDPSGHNFGKDLDPKKEQDVCEKPGKKESEGEAEGDRNFSVLALRDIRRRFNYEHLSLSGQFGAIPRNPQRDQTLENPNLHAVAQRRNSKEENKNWQEVNPASPGFACIYQQSLSFASELPRLNARFLLNLSPYLQPYIRPFRENDARDSSNASDFEKFDVAIKPEILKNKPITRSAVALALHRQLHKILEEPYREIRLNEIAIQTVQISEDDEDEGGASGSCIQNNSDNNSIREVKSQESKCTENLNSSSLWDSGYGEKVFDERCTTFSEHKESDSELIDQNSHINIISNLVPENLNSKTCDDVPESNFILITDSTHDKDGDFFSSANETSEHRQSQIVSEAKSSNNQLNVSPTAQSGNDLEIEKKSNVSSEFCDNLFIECEENKHVRDEICSNLSNDFCDTNVFEESGYHSLNECSGILSENATTIKNCESQNGSGDEHLLLNNEIQKNENRDAHSDVTVEYVKELNINVDASNYNFAGTEIPEQKIKNQCFEENLNGLDITKSSCKEFGNYPHITQTNSNNEKNYPKITQTNSSNEKNYLEADNNNDLLSDSDANSVICTFEEKNKNFEKYHTSEKNICPDSDLEPIQNTAASRLEGNQRSDDEYFFLSLRDMSVEKKNLDSMARTFGVDVENVGEDESSKCLTLNSADSDLERFQNIFDRTEEQNNHARSAAEDTKLSEKRNYRLTETAAPSDDVIQEGSSRDPAVFDEKETFNLPRQMDRETSERSVAVESTVTTETTLRGNGETRLSTAVVSRLTLDEWSAGSFDKEDSVCVKTTVSEEVFRPTFEEFVPLKTSENVPKKEVTTKNESFEDILSDNSKNENENDELSSDDLPSSPRVDRLKGLISRDEERRSRTKFQHLADSSHVGGAMEGEWDRLLRDVLASVSELERWERRHCDVSSDAEDAEQQHQFSQSDSSFTMEEEAVSPKGETPTKVKNLRFKLDPDVFDVPSDDSFYDDDEEDYRRGWKKQPKYRAFSTLELKDEPVKLVSVHASVVPAGQKMVARPVGIDLRVRLTEERQSKRAHVSTSPSQAKRRSPVSDRGIGWCQELSPVTENVDWRETFTPVTPECKSVPNGILKTPSPKIDPSPIESPNPFKQENSATTNGVSTNGVTTNGVAETSVIPNGVKANGVSSMSENKRIEKPKYNGWKPPVERKPFLIIRRKFEPDPEAIERITGYKSALSKPPLPPPLPHKPNNLTARNRAELARKQYLDNKAALANSKIDSTKKFQQFLSQTQNDRAKIVTSVPDLAAIERAVTEQWTKERKSVSPRESPGRDDNKKNDGIKKPTESRGSTPDDQWASYVQSCRQHLSRRSQSMTYLETDIDIIPVLDEDDKCHSTSCLDEPDEALPDPDDSDLDRSREDLDDSGRAKSEHELRIERSLRSLPVPDWYRKSDKPKTGFLLSSSNKEKRGWAAVKSLASSTSSLASCGLRRPVRSLRSSRENIPWSRSSASPDGPTLSLALAKAFREPYLGWRARTPTSSGVSSSPRASPPSWNATTTTTDDEANGVSFDGEDAFGRTTSSEDDRRDEPLSLDDTGADAVTVSMDTNDPVKLPGGEDTCDDINNMSMDTCELFDASVVVPVDEDPSPQADTGDDIDNLSTDTTTTEGRKLDPKLKRYSYSQSIYHSEWDEEEESRGDKKVKEEDREPIPTSPDHKVVWIESSFVGSRTTTSIVVLPEKNAPGSTQERPASR